MSSNSSNHSFAENNQAMEDGEAMEDDEAMEQVDMALFDSLPNQITLEYANGIQLFSQMHSWSSPY